VDHRALCLEAKSGPPLLLRGDPVVPDIATTDVTLGLRRLSILSHTASENRPPAGQPATAIR
jgi:hypothetical protein